MTPLLNNSSLARLHVRRHSSTVNRSLKGWVTCTGNRHDRNILAIAWLGWVFDAMDATIYAIVLHPALHDLLQSSGGTVSSEQVGWYGGIIFSIFLIGWAIGGVLFGVVADHLGRTKTLIITILIYAVFTGLAALAQDWWHLAIYRFLTALGIGGENGRPARHSLLKPGRKRNERKPPAFSSRLGGRILPRCLVQFAPEGLWVAGEVCDRCTPGLCVVAGPLAREGA